MKPLNFHGNHPKNRIRMSRRAWFTVFGAERIQPSQKIFAKELEERLVKLYDDIEMNEVYEPLNNYITLRNQHSL